MVKIQVASTLEGARDVGSRKNANMRQVRRKDDVRMTQPLPPTNVARVRFRARLRLVD